MAETRKHLNLSALPSRGMDALSKGSIRAAFCDAVSVPFGDSTLLFISGKTATDAEGKIIARTMREQTRQVLENIKAVLQHEGASFDDVVRVRVYVTQLDSASLREIHEVRMEYFSPDRLPASTLVRVDQLVRDGALIEIDADAVVRR